MDLLKKLTWKNLQLNKKRAIMTIIGIMLSVSLLTAVASMFFSARTSLIRHEIEETGNFHYGFFHVPMEEAEGLKEHRKVEKVYFTNPVGYALLEGIQNEDKPYVYVQSYDQEAMENMGITLTKGRLPEKEGEILISEHLSSNGGVELKVGEKIRLEVGVRMGGGFELNQTNPYDPSGNETIEQAETKEYVIVGEMERLSLAVEPYSAPGYTFITCLTENEKADFVDVYIRYNRAGLKEHYALTAQILNVKEESFRLLHNDSEFFRLEDEKQNEIHKEIQNGRYAYSIHEQLIMLETGVLGSSTLNALAAAAVLVVVIIIVTSVFCIRNSFDISITEKIRQYGMLSSVGATKKQIRKNVYYEACLLGAAGIPLGLLAGIAASMVLIHVSNHFLKDDFNILLVFDLSWPVIVCAVLLSMITILLSARKSAVKASKISPIQAIRNSEDIKINRAKITCPKWVGKIFGVGGEISYKNLKRSRKKYRATIISIIVCVSVFIALYSFVDLAFRVVDNEIEQYGYSIQVSYTSDGTDDYGKQAKSMDHTKDVNAMSVASVIWNEVPYTEEYRNFHKETGVRQEDVDVRLRTYIMDEDDFKEYISKLHLNYEEVKDKGILINQVDLFYYKEEIDDYIEMRIDQYDLKAGDWVDGNFLIRGEDTEIMRTEPVHIQIAAVTDEVPMGVPRGGQEAYFIVNEQYGKKLTGSTFLRYISIDSVDAVENEKDIEAIFSVHEDYYNILNIHENAKGMESTYTLIAIFLYGFIIVIALIGVTNIFNTITTNMNLRRREFAMLRSIGMTEKEFRRMVSLESFFYGTNSLMIGVPIGTILSYIIFKVLMTGSFRMKYELPMTGILIAAGAVFLLIWVIMNYSMNQIGKQNVIETIRNENI